LRVEARIGGWSDALYAAVHPRVQGLIVTPGEPTLASFQVESQDELPGVAAAIVGAGGALYALVPHGESLEDTFMRLVEGTP
jgi:hypothetical protein